MSLAQNAQLLIFSVTAAQGNYPDSLYETVINHHQQEGVEGHKESCGDFQITFQDGSMLIYDKMRNPRLSVA